MKLFRYSILIAAVLFIAKPAAASSITLMVGDNDWFGTGSSANVGNLLLDGAVREGRDGAEQSATNGAQLTDIYTALYPTVAWGCGVGLNPPLATNDSGCTPNGDKGFVSFPLTNYFLQSGTVSARLGGFQSLQFGTMLVDINGVSITLAANDGYQGTSLWSYQLTQQMIDAANAAGEVRINFDDSLGFACDATGKCTGSEDYIAFDYFQLDAEVAPVPEPGTMVLVGLGLAGSALAARRRLRV